MAELSVKNATEILARLQQAAPQATANRLAQIMSLLESLAAENAYLNSRVSEDHSLLDTVAAPETKADPQSPLASPTFPATNEAITGDTSAMDLLAGANDALRAPLVAIRSRAELIEAGLLGQINKEQEQWLNAIHENTSRAFTLLDAVQQIIALHESKVRIDWSNFISSDLLEEAYERVRERVAANHQEVIIQKSRVTPMAQGDFYQSLIILTNLLDNAMRYSPPGGQIRLSVDNLGTHVLFSVADSGIGLTPEDMQNIGRPFWRGEHHRLVKQHPGTGLTLFLAKRVLALEEGELIFYGEPDLGSTFSFTLKTPT